MARVLSCLACCNKCIVTPREISDSWRHCRFSLSVKPLILVNPARKWTSMRVSRKVHAVFLLSSTYFYVLPLPYAGQIIQAQDDRSIRSRIFIGNLNTLVISRADMERHFRRYGRVKAMGIFKGYAFIQFDDEVR